MDVLLAEEIIDVNEKNGCGWTPLHKIASVNDSEGSGECVRLLHAQNAAIDARDSNGNTPVFIY